MDNLQIIGAIKIKDGLFMGDEYSAQDLDFMVTNKITFIINCAGKQIPNIWESISLNYLSFPWQETDSQVNYSKFVKTFDQEISSPPTSAFYLFQ